MIKFNKLLIASLTVVALGATVSCNNNGKEFVGGLPYTLVETDTWLDDGQQLTLGFNYTGANMKVYWSDNIEEPSTEQFHIFTGSGESRYPYFLVEGDITSISFTYEDGKSIAPDNEQITTVVFSNTITSLPKNACGSLCNLDTVYIPNSVKQVGEYAFAPYNYEHTTFFCEAETRPSTWSPNWYYAPIFGNAVNWGFAYHITEDGQAYILYNKEGLHLANYMGYIFPTTVRKLVIPQTIKINNYKFDVFAIFDLGYASNTVEMLEINNKVEYIGHRAFGDCEKLKSVEFIGDFDYLYLEHYVFGYCGALESVTLPKGLVNLSYSLFEGCNELTRVNIPGTVQYLDVEVFWDACDNKTLNIDLTGYKTAKSIPYCDAAKLFDSCRADTITFTFARSVGDKSAFIEKGWPRTMVDDATVIWQVAEA